MDMTVPKRRQLNGLISQLSNCFMDMVKVETYHFIWWNYVQPHGEQWSNCPDSQFHPTTSMSNRTLILKSHANNIYGLWPSIRHNIPCWYDETLCGVLKILPDTNPDAKTDFAAHLLTNSHSSLVKFPSFRNSRSEHIKTEFAETHPAETIWYQNRVP